MGAAFRLATVVSPTSPVRPPSRRPRLSVLAAGPATNMGNDSAKLEKVPANRLFTSEPDPRMFGNGKNPSPRPANWTNDNWLKSHFHFSFAEYRDPHNQSFGALRVMNDDLVQPARGFGTHGHANAEVIHPSPLSNHTGISLVVPPTASVPNLLPALGTRY